MNKDKLIVANWKMNLLYKNAFNFCKKISLKNKLIKNKFVICPPTTIISQLSTKFKKINFGAQDCSAVEEFGAYTGDINSKMLKDINCKYTLIGHSERRELHKEDESLISLKILSVLKANINPILCVGENLNQKKKGSTKKVLKHQLTNVLSTKKKFKKVIIAYEPVWAIGTGKTPTVEDISNTILYIKDVLAKKSDIYRDVKVLYGGSVNVNNSKLFLNNTNIDGLLVGGASLNFNSFLSMLKYQ